MTKRSSWNLPAVPNFALSCENFKIAGLGQEKGDETPFTTWSMMFVWSFGKFIHSIILHCFRIASIKKSSPSRKSFQKTCQTAR